MSSENKEKYSGFGMGMVAALAAKRKAEAERLAASSKENSEKQDLSLGELNPLIHTVDFKNSQVIESLKAVSYHLIHKYKGLTPVKLETAVVASSDGKSNFPRFIARFETEQLNEIQMNKLENLVKNTYPVSVRGRRDFDGSPLPTEKYPAVNKDPKAKTSETSGWYIGPYPVPTDPTSKGLFIFRDLGEINEKNFTSDKLLPKKHIIELREGEMYQTDFVEFLTQVSSILGTSKTLDHGKLQYEAYYELMRLGLKNFDPDSIYGMDNAISQIKRGLLIPLANPDLSKGLKQEPESVLLSGVPGTGKTLIVEKLLHEDTGVFILPLDPIDLLRELTMDPEKQNMLRRITNISKTTKKKVVIHIDDIENATSDDDKTRSSLLNLMAGVRDSGFYLIASTNEPEKIGTALLQPQRFGVLIYCGLQDEKARYEILKIQATQRSKRLNLPLFASDEEREIILKEVVRLTENFTPRYLAEIATVAKSYLAERIALKKKKNIGLTEDNLREESFTIEDWEKAFRDVSVRYDRKGTIKRDGEIKEFIKNSRESLGFKLNPTEDNTIFSADVHQKIVEIRNRQEKLMGH